MHWTGELYGFYTEKPIELVFNVFQKKSLEIGYKFDYFKNQNEEILLFYKDEKMLEYHLDNGYNTAINGEGCFCVEAKVVKLDGIASLFEFEGNSNFEPCDINLAFSKVFYYVLIVPDSIENSIFSAKIHELFHNILIE